MFNVLVYAGVLYCRVAKKIDRLVFVDLFCI